MSAGANSYSNTTKYYHTAFATGTRKLKKMQINKKSDLLILNAALDVYLHFLHMTQHRKESSEIEEYRAAAEELAVRIIKELEKE